MNDVQFRRPDIYFSCLYFNCLEKHEASNEAGLYKEGLHYRDEDSPTFRFIEINQDCYRSNMKRGMIQIGLTTIVMGVLGLSSYGCASHTLQEHDRNMRQTSPLDRANQSTHHSPEPSTPPLASNTSITSSLKHVKSKVAGPLTLSRLEDLAQEHNPTLRQARMQIEGERAKALQAGLYPNPSLGYSGEQIGVNGTAGEFQGGFVQQQIVTAGKLRLSREKYLARASAAEFQALAQEYRIINDVRIRYARVLGAQERLAIQRELLQTAQDRLLTVQEMVNVGQANQADLSQANVLHGEQDLLVKMAENDLEMEWEWLMTVIGIPQPLTAVPGNLEEPTDPIQWEPSLQRLLTESPELELARAVLKADAITIEREKIQPIPDLVLRGSAGRNYDARQTVYGVGAFIEVPIFDWNQGTVRQAQADYRQQQAEVRLTELRLRRSLATQYQQYRTALQHVKSYRAVILPESEQRYRLRLKSYEDHRETWPAVLEAQQDFFGRRLIYVDHLVAFRSTQVAIEGLLLVDGLIPPGGVTLPGHIDATPKPR